MLGKLAKNEFCGVIFKIHCRSEKIQKYIWVHRPSKPNIDFLEMPTLMGESLCHMGRIDVKQNQVFNMY